MIEGSIAPSIAMTPHPTGTSRRASSRAPDSSWHRPARHPAAGDPAGPAAGVSGLEARMIAASAALRGRAADAIRRRPAVAAACVRVVATSRSAGDVGIRAQAVIGKGGEPRGSGTAFASRRDAREEAPQRDRGRRWFRRGGWSRTASDVGERAAEPPRQVDRSVRRHGPQEIAILGEGLWMSSRAACSAVRAAGRSGSGE